MRKILGKLFESRKKKTQEHDFEWERFQLVAKEQFKKLKDKGLTIPVVTL